MTARFDDFDDDPITLARRLLGQRLVRIVNGRRLAGIIVETEAYLGAADRAAHTYNGRRTPRNQSMYLPGGHAYVYFTYGMHHCLNVVCGRRDEGVAVLIRAIEPTEGLEAMFANRPGITAARDLCSGPGRLTQALAINLALDGVNLRKSRALFIERARGRMLPGRCIRAARRIGVDYAGHWGRRLLRFLRQRPSERDAAARPSICSCRPPPADILTVTHPSMSQSKSQPDLKSMLRAAGPYPMEAFNFVREGLGYTVQRLHKDHEALPDAARHISGQQLCLGLRDYAIEQYGLMAATVLASWHVSRTDDFGRIVFAMIDAGLMSKTDQDDLDDFRAVYDFAEAFDHAELLARIGPN
jgi:DNA-3-methyladenine glycosylase